MLRRGSGGSVLVGGPLRSCVELVVELFLQGMGEVARTYLLIPVSPWLRCGLWETFYPQGGVFCGLSYLDFALRQKKKETSAWSWRVLMCTETQRQVGWEDAEGDSRESFIVTVLNRLGRQIIPIWIMPKIQLSWYLLTTFKRRR